MIVFLVIDILAALCRMAKEEAIEKTRGDELSRMHDECSKVPGISQDAILVAAAQPGGSVRGGGEATVNTAVVAELFRYSRRHSHVSPSHPSKGTPEY